MKKKDKKYRMKPVGGFDQISSSTEFYSSGPAEKPLSGDTRVSDSHRVRKTGRHQAVTGIRTDRMDPREKLALLAILKSVVMVLLLAIAFFMLWKGIGLYEESIWLEHADTPEKSPVLQEVALVEDFDIQSKGSRELFVERIELWQEADRLVRSADALLQRNNYGQAIEQCQEALRHDPAHRGALERLGRLYYANGDIVEAVNAYIRLLSVDPSDEEIQKRLMAALDAFGDHDAVQRMAEWYLKQNISDSDVQRYLANALYTLGDFEAAAAAYGRLLRESPKDILSMERQTVAYMQTQQYEKALVPLAKLRENDLRNPVYYKQIAVCNAQLRKSKETVQVLGRAAELFGQQMVGGLIQDPRLDPVREDRVFQAFTDRVAGEEFRRELEELARRAEISEKERADLDPLLEMPVSEFQNEELLKTKKK